MRYVVELCGADRNGRKMIAWGRRIGCAEAGHGFDPVSRQPSTKLFVDAANPSQRNFLMELADNPQGLRAMNVANAQEPPPPLL